MAKLRCPIRHPEGPGMSFTRGPRYSRYRIIRGGAWLVGGCSGLRDAVSLGLGAIGE